MHRCTHRPVCARDACFRVRKTDIADSTHLVLSGFWFVAQPQSERAAALLPSDIALSIGRQFERVFEHAQFWQRKRLGSGHCAEPRELQTELNLQTESRHEEMVVPSSGFLLRCLDAPVTLRNHYLSVIFLIDLTRTSTKGRVRLLSVV